MVGGPKLIECRVCDAIMNSFGKDICPKCYRAEEELFQKMKSFLRENNDANIAQIAMAIECSAEQVERFIDSGRLEKTGMNISRPCQMCQMPIKSGRLCNDCNRQVTGQAGISAAKKDSTEKSSEPAKADASKLFGKKQSRGGSVRKWNTGK